MSSKFTTAILAPIGYQEGSEIKLWVVQDGNGDNELIFAGPFVDHTGKGLQLFHRERFGVDYYHAFLRSKGVWWVETHN